MGCLGGCGTEEYKTVQYGDYTFDCQTIAENWASTIPQQWQVESRSGLEPHAIGSTFK
jgi:hypothetical protein